MKCRPWPNSQIYGLSFHRAWGYLIFTYKFSFLSSFRLNPKNFQTSKEADTEELGLMQDKKQIINLSVDTTTFFCQQRSCQWRASSLWEVNAPLGVAPLWCSFSLLWPLDFKSNCHFSQDLDLYLFLQGCCLKELSQQPPCSHLEIVPGHGYFHQALFDYLRTMTPLFKKSLMILWSLTAIYLINCEYRILCVPYIWITFIPYSISVSFMCFYYCIRHKRLTSSTTS